MDKANSRHGGDVVALATVAGCAPEEILDFSASINPLGPPGWLREAVNSSVAGLARYPDPSARGFVDAVSRRFKVAPEQVVVGNGSSEILDLLPRVVPAKRAVVLAPSYGEYRRASCFAGLPVETVSLLEQHDFVPHLETIENRIQEKDLVFLGQPNNPTGIALPPNELRALARRHPLSWFLVDEAFADFVPEMASLIENRPDNVIVVRSLTKIYAIPGLRLGFAAASEGLAAKVRERAVPWSVNAVAAAVGVRALADEGYERAAVDYIRARKRELVAGLAGIRGLKVYPGQANYLLVQIERGAATAEWLSGRLLEVGIAIRACGDFDGLDGRFFRVAVRTGEENDRLLDALQAVLEGHGRGDPPALRMKKHNRRPQDCPHKPAIMFQGTASNVGKSVLVAAFCRLLAQDGYRVAPFKSQNMSLNSGVTWSGGEMGRAQILQAEAARVPPDVRMNPILLKPSSDVGAQVIALGKAVGNMSVTEYIRFKAQAWTIVQEAYDALAEEFEVLVLEGAGSPAEVNLKEHDIANMRVAQYAGSPVVLVGDIDRGGVFASLVGTMELLEEWERSLVTGFLINKFRGDETLLADAIERTEASTGRPTLGVVPYIPSLGLPDEDSVTFKGSVTPLAPKSLAGTGSGVDLGVIDLPHASNLTDIDPFVEEPDVGLHVVRSVEELRAGHFDAVVLPGSKNVDADLKHLRDSGIADELKCLARAGQTEIVGICGGLQMLGVDVADPHALESAETSTPGLALLPVSTVLEPEKTLRRVGGRHVASGFPVHGYEIHHGRTDCGNLDAPLVGPDGEVLAVASKDGLVWGTYLHGLFDADRFRRWFVDELRLRRGLPALGQVCATYDLDPALDRLAAVVRANVDVPRLYRSMGL